MGRSPEEVTARITPHAEALGLELVEVACKGPDKRRFLRVLVHKEGGVTLEDCRALASVLQTDFDENAFFFPGHYNLEVASPGLDRPLKSARDFARNLGQKVRVFLTEPFEGKAELTGTIAGVAAERVQLDADRDGAAIELALEHISRGKLVLKF